MFTDCDFGNRLGLTEVFLTLGGISVSTRKPDLSKCHKPLKLLLMKAMPGRKDQCIDCDGEDPLRSPDISKLLQNVRPPE